MANIKRFDFKDIPQDAFVITTWHDDESLEEVFWFCKNNAFRPSVKLANTIVLHIAPRANEQAILKSYAEAEPLHRADSFRPTASNCRSCRTLGISTAPTKGSSL